MNTPKFNFEEAMNEIKTIVEQIESGQLSLDDSIKQYERALQLIKQCQDLLQNAQQKIADISENK